MDIRTKSVSLILLIFVLGVLTGFFLHGYFPDRRFRPMGSENGRPFSLSQRLDELLKLSPNQRQEINPIIIRFDRKLRLTIERSRNSGMMIMDSLSSEIKPFLSDKQKSILEDELDHFKNPQPPGPRQIQ